MEVDYTSSRHFLARFTQFEDFAIIVGMLVFTFLNKESMSLQQVPIEQALLFLVVIYMTLLEVSYTDNKLRLQQHRAKFYVNLVRKSYPTLAFLTEKQQQNLKSSSVIWLAVIGSIMMYMNQLWQFFVLLLAMFATLLYRCDFIVYHHLLGRSIVYANKVTRLLVEGVYNWLVLSWVMLTLVRKAAPTLNRAEFVLIERYVMVGYTIFFSLCMAFFLWRQWRLYRK